MRIDDVIARCRVSTMELTAWIDESWVRPIETDGGYRFDEADVARIELICDLRETMAIDDEAMPLVLSLLDQLYSARRLLAGVTAALDDLPAPLREEVRRYLGEGPA